MTPLAFNVSTLQYTTEFFNFLKPKNIMFVLLLLLFFITGGGGGGGGGSSSSIAAPSGRAV